MFANAHIYRFLPVCCKIRGNCPCCEVDFLFCFTCWSLCVEQQQMLFYLFFPTTFHQSNFTFECYEWGMTHSVTRGTCGDIKNMQSLAERHCLPHTVQCLFIQYWACYNGPYLTKGLVFSRAKTPFSHGQLGGCKKPLCDAFASWFLSKCRKTAELWICINTAED